MYPPIYTAITTPWPYTLLEVMPSADSIKIETEKEDSFFFFQFCLTSPSLNKQK